MCNHCVCVSVAGVRAVQRLAEPQEQQQHSNCLIQEGEQLIAALRTQVGELEEKLPDQTQEVERLRSGVVSRRERGEWRKLGRRETGEGGGMEKENEGRAQLAYILGKAWERRAQDN